MTAGLVVMGQMGSTLPTRESENPQPRSGVGSGVGGGSVIGEGGFRPNPPTGFLLKAADKDDSAHLGTGGDCGTGSDIGDGKIFRGSS